MRYKYLMLLLVPVLLFSCKKDMVTQTVSNPTNPGNPGDPSAARLLKEITIPRLPSPFFHFEYNNEGRVTFASFASGLTMYNIRYDGDRISEMQNDIIVNKDRLQYFYDSEGRVIAVRLSDSLGVVSKRYDLTYNGQQLIKFERKRKSGAAFITDRTMTFSYLADGNLQSLTTHYEESTGQPEATFVDSYELYDNKVNADAFSLLHPEFFEHLILLPGVQLQKNNPGKITHTGDGDNYKIDYSYTYNDTNQPLVKTGDLLFTVGTMAGQRFLETTFYSYY